MSQHVLILSNAGSEDEATAIAHALVREHLAACVNIIPRIQSVYRWEGQIEQVEEWMMIVKTTRRSAKRTMARLVTLHSYELPAAVVLEMTDGHQPYLDWIQENVHPA